MTDTSSSRLAVTIPPVLMLVLGANWGLGFSLGKLGVTGGLAPYAYAFWQTGGAGVVLLVLALSRGLRLPLDVVHVRYYMISGLTNVAIPNVVALTCAQYIPVGIAVMISTLAPLMTYAAALLVRIEYFDRRRALGVAIGFAGTLFILVPRTSLPSPDIVGWVVLAMLTPTFYGFSNVYVAWARPPKIPSLALAAGLQVCAGLCLVPMLIVTGSFHVPFPPRSVAEIANVSHILAASLGSLLFYEILRMAGPVFTSQVAYVICLTGVFWGKLFFDESHSLWVWAAMVVILVGLALVTWPAKRAT